MGALDPQMVKHLHKTVGYRKVCSCCHPLTSFIWLHRWTRRQTSRSVFLALNQSQLP